MTRGVLNEERPPRRGHSDGGRSGQARVHAQCHSPAPASTIRKSRLAMTFRTADILIFAAFIIVVLALVIFLPALLPPDTGVFQ